jgi:hypothetical protein
VHTNNGWQLAKDIALAEIKRIEKRFDARIIAKLERLTCRVDD